MSTLLRIDIEHDTERWSAKFYELTDAPKLLFERAGSVDSKGFPLPPASDVPAGLPWEPLCKPDAVDARDEAHNRFLEGNPRSEPPDVQLLGGYLFAVLLGEQWVTLKDGAGELRLQLGLPASGPWRSLPWELMLNADGPLTTGARFTTVSRLVGTSAAPELLTFELPIRVLFVIGRELDLQVRPGTEYLAVLRRLSCTLGTPDQALGVALHTRLLVQATSLSLESAVREFRPSVVHVISHGRTSAGESTIVLTADAPDAGRAAKTDPVNAARLAQILGANTEFRPSAVILNACNTAESGGVSAAFASALVGHGIPIVVGMAGEVADTACRLFASEFYSALADRRPVDVATGRGRRAALLHFKNHTQSFDWARAVLCQASNVSVQFQSSPMKTALLRAAERVRPKNQREPFCARLSWLSDMRDLAERKLKNLAIETDEEDALEENVNERARLGKSRLLEELRWQAVLENWIPVYIGQYSSSFANPMDFAVRLFEQLETTREVFGLPRANRSEVLTAGFERWSIPTPDTTPAFLSARDALLRATSKQQVLSDRISLDTIREHVRSDIQALRQDVETQAGPCRGLMLLWDQLDQHEGVATELVKTNLIGPDGLGTAACPMPVVFTYGRRSRGGKKLLNAINGNPDISKRNLSRFDEFETALACRQFLTWKKYAPSRLNPTLVDQSLRVFEEETEGYPSKLYGLDFGIKLMLGQKLLIECDDDAILKQNK